MRKSGSVVDVEEDRVPGPRRVDHLVGEHGAHIRDPEPDPRITGHPTQSRRHVVVRPADQRLLDLDHVDRLDPSVEERFDG
jgi:hypothetical protein